MTAVTHLARFSFDDSQLLAVAVVAAVIAVTTSAMRRAPRRCPRCREINREAAVYCAQCGTKLPER